MNKSNHEEVEKPWRRIFRRKDKASRASPDIREPPPNPQSTPLTQSRSTSHTAKFVSQPWITTAEVNDHGKLWAQAHHVLEKDSKTASLMHRYHGLLNGDLEKGDRRYKDPANQELMDELLQEKLSVMVKKQWILPWGKSSFVVHDKAEKIIKIIQQFSTLGTAAASLDPTHAGIAWAGVCVLLPLILNNFTEQEKAMDGLEDITRILARYTAVEQLLPLSAVESLDINFEKSILDVYMNILMYQATAACHFSRSTLPRMVANITTTNDWTGMLKKLQSADANCQSFVSIKSTEQLLKQIRLIPEGYDRKLFDDWKENQTKSDEILRQWIDNRLRQSEDQQEENQKTVRWISDTRVGEDHAAARERLGSSYWNSGQWLLNPPGDQKSSLEDWKLSGNGQLWLCGSVGTGKTSLMSILIDDLIRNQPQIRLAFCYCSKNSAMNTPVEILKSLLAQLSWTTNGFDIAEDIRKIYVQRATGLSRDSSLSVSECVDLLATLIRKFGPTIIVIDALDECKSPMELLRKLSELGDKTQELKFLFSSREGVQVTRIFPGAQLVSIDSHKSLEDIERYITTELSRPERCNSEIITDKLAKRMKDVLLKLSDGMFRWVELQLDLFINSEYPMKHQKDFEDRLRKLENDSNSSSPVKNLLKDAYDDTFYRNVQEQPFSRSVAIRALQWTLCTSRQFDIEELRAALASDGASISRKFVVDVCSNFIYVDNTGLVRLAHISVKEYLQEKKIDGRFVFSPGEAHACATISCLMEWKSSIDGDIDPNPTKFQQPSFTFYSYDNNDVVSEPQNKSQYNPSISYEYDSDTKMYAQAYSRLYASLDSTKPESSPDSNSGSEVKSKIESGLDSKMESEIKAESKAETQVEFYGSLQDPLDLYNHIRTRLLVQWHDTERQAKEDEVFRRAARSSWRCYASLYWMHHYQNANKDVIQESFGVSPRQELLTFLREEDLPQTPIAKWLTQLSHLRDSRHKLSATASSPVWISNAAHEKDLSTFEVQWLDITKFSHVSMVTSEHQAVFFTGCKYGLETELLALCDMDQCKHFRLDRGKSGLQVSASYGHQGIVALLLNAGAVDEMEAKTTALHEACQAGHLQVVRTLLGANPAWNSSYVNLKDYKENSPLLMAIMNNHSAVVALLLKQPGIDINTSDYSSMTALHHAWRHSPGSLQLLLQDGRANVNSLDIWGRKYNKVKRL